MAIDFKLNKVVIRCFRGIKHLELEFVDNVPTVLIGANNAGKSTILNAIALALGGGGFHQWAPSEEDFYCDEKGKRSLEFVVQVHFRSQNATGYPAVRGVGQAKLIHGVQVKGRTTKDGKMSHSRTLIDDQGSTVTIPTRTPMNEADKKKYAEHDVGYRVVNARLDDISEYAPEVWLFKPQNIEASLYIWKTGPIARLSRFLAARFLQDEWTLKRADGDRPMPATLRKAHDFFQEAVGAFPFWKDDMKPTLEGVFGRYVGTHATIDLKPDTQLLEDWLAQQLAISLATDPESTTTPLRNMGDGWQSVIRLAALEALSSYPQLLKDRVVLLLEEPETYLHPHLCRKIRRVLSDLAAKGWTVVYSTHSSELVSFEARQNISRLLRSKGAVVCRSIDTGQIDRSAKLQSKLDEHGAHDFLFSTAAVFCEGKDDSFAVRLAFDHCNIDYDARSISVTQCGSVSAMPAFAEISGKLGIRWCALTDEDRLADGSINPKTEKHRGRLDTHKAEPDCCVLWPGSLEQALKVLSGKATPEVTAEKLTRPDWKARYPDFTLAVKQIASWIDASLRV
jgi:predicted ATP-dependent endonuclease of OLD family